MGGHSVCWADVYRSTVVDSRGKGWSKLFTSSFVSLGYAFNMQDAIFSSIFLAFRCFSSRDALITFFN